MISLLPSALVSLTAVAYVAPTTKLEAFLRDLNALGAQDAGGFQARIEAQFAVSAEDVRLAARSCRRPSELFMRFYIARAAKVTAGKVEDIQHRMPGAPWHEIARAAGILDGHPTFLAIKRGQLALAPLPSGKPVATPKRRR